MELYHWDLFSPDIDEYLRAEIAKKLESIEESLNDIYFLAVDYNFEKLLLPHKKIIFDEIAKLFEKLVYGGKP